MLTRTLLLAALIPLTLADVQFTSPAAGTTLQAGKPIIANWKDSGDGTALKDLETYVLFLCAGGNDEASIVGVLFHHDRFSLTDHHFLQVQIAPINANGQFSTGNTASATVAANLGGPAKNA